MMLRKDLHRGNPPPEALQHFLFIANIPMEDFYCDWSSLRVKGFIDLAESSLRQGPLDCEIEQMVLSRLRTDRPSPINRLTILLPEGAILLHPCRPPRGKDLLGPFIKLNANLVRRELLKFLG